MIDKKRLVKVTLSAEAFWSVNKALARKIGIEEAALTAEIIFKHTYWEEKGELDDQGGFFMISEDIQTVMGIGIKPVARLTKSILTQGVVKIKKRGVPAKNYWYPQWDFLFEVLSSEPQKGLSSTTQKGAAAEAQKGGAITKNVNEESIPMTPRPFKESKPKRKNVSRETIYIPEIESLLSIVVNSGVKESTISSNMKMLMLNAVNLHGLEFCEKAMRGRVIEAARKDAGLALTVFLDPENGDWMDRCAKLGTAPTVKADRPVLTPEQEQEYRELSHQVPA